VSTVRCEPLADRELPPHAARWLLVPSPGSSATASDSQSRTRSVSSGHAPSRSVLVARKRGVLAVEVNIRGVRYREKRFRIGLSSAVPSSVKAWCSSSLGTGHGTHLSGHPPPPTMPSRARKSPERASGKEQRDGPRYVRCSRRATLRRGALGSRVVRIGSGALMRVGEVGEAGRPSGPLGV
jgi:hypothetical protein